MSIEEKLDLVLKKIEYIENDIVLLELKFDKILNKNDILKLDMKIMECDIKGKIRSLESDIEAITEMLKTREEGDLGKK